MSEPRPCPSKTLRLNVALLALLALETVGGCVGDGPTEQGTDPRAESGDDALPQTLGGLDAGSALDAATPPAPDAAVATGSACDELSYESFGRQFFLDYCKTCHRLPNPTFNDIDEVTTFRNRIATRVLQSPASPMPPLVAAKRPSDEDKRKLGLWLKCDPLD